MTDAPPSQAAETSLHRVPADDEIEAAVRDEHRSISESVRDHVLDRDDRCQVSGCRRISSPDTPSLFVQRIDDDPPHCHPDDPENLAARCLDCACWIEQMPTRDDLPAVLQERLDETDLDADHIEILRYLHGHGPAQTGEVTEAVDRTNPTSVRRVLYDLMARDVRDDAVSGRLVAKDRLANTYGLPWQIPDERDARGVIPLEPHTRRTRILDAVVSRLLEVLDGRVDDPREIAAAVVDRKPNQTYNMEKRAAALQFPFEDWAENKRSRCDAAAAIEAISIFAGVTENVSRRHVAAPLVEILNDNDEHELATVLDRSLLADGDPPFDALASHPTEQQGASKQTSEPPSERTGLQIFRDADADTDAGTQTTGETVQGRPHSEGHDS